ncbi:tripartite tricarboxylate transporter TctB family protein [Prosthecomicrobium sp. N25]|uniref:tripartite tricarboxylate transporter TctB family protein n=1 Tax=Prosthecomicrobium sp. N25 TaxID=3129254 RepID=UPI0030771E5B
MHLSDRLTGTALAVLGAAAFAGGSRLPPVPGQQVGPNVFPMVIGAGLVVCGLLIALKVGSSFEEEHEVVAAEDGTVISEAEAERRMSPARRLSVLIPPGLLLFYYFMVDRLGFVPTGFVMVLTTALALGARWRLALGVALLAPVGVHLIFLKLLRVPLPAGLLPMPW